MKTIKDNLELFHILSFQGIYSLLYKMSFALVELLWIAYINILWSLVDRSLSNNNHTTSLIVFTNSKIDSVLIFDCWDITVIRILFSRNR